MENNVDFLNIFYWKLQNFYFKEISKNIIFIRLGRIFDSHMKSHFADRSQFFVQHYSSIINIKIRSFAFIRFVLIAYNVERMQILSIMIFSPQIFCLWTDFSNFSKPKQLLYNSAPTSFNFGWYENTRDVNLVIPIPKIPGFLGITRSRILFCFGIQ